MPKGGALEATGDGGRSRGPAYRQDGPRIVISSVGAVAASPASGRETGAAARGIAAAQARAPAGRLTSPSMMMMRTTRRRRGGRDAKTGRPEARR